MEVIAEPLITKMALSSAPALRGSVALVVTFLGLVVTALITDGLNIDGATTWILATIIVWLGGLLAGLILPAIFLKRAVDDEPGMRKGGATYSPTTVTNDRSCGSRSHRGFWREAPSSERAECVCVQPVPRRTRMRPRSATPAVTSSTGAARATPSSRTARAAPRP